MKLAITFLTILFLSNDVLAQEHIFELKSYNTNRKIRQYNRTPEIYHVTHKETTTVVVKKNERQTKEYKELKNQIARLKKTQEGMNNLPTSVPVQKTYNSVPEIIEQIQKYNESALSYGLKKKYLLKAQQLIDRSELSHLVYADSRIHPDKITKFSSLTKNPLDLKIHLKRVIWDLENTRPILVADANNSAPSVNTDSLAIIKDQLASLEEKLKTTQRYETINNGEKSYTRMAYLLQAKVASPTSLFGTFELEKGDYYVMGYDYKKFKRDELLDAVTMKKYGIKPKQMTFSKAKKLIHNSATNEYYLVSQEFKTLFAYLKPTTALATNRVYKNTPTTVVKKTSYASMSPSKTNPSKKVKPIVTYTHKSRIVEDSNFGKTKATLDSYKKAIKESESLTSKLDDHYKALMDGKMNAKRAKEWKNDIIKAEKLHQNIVTMTGKSPKSIKQFNEDMDPKYIDNYYDFSKALSSAKRVSGY